MTLAIIPQPADDRDINCDRYRHFHRYLAAVADDYDRVMLSDSRDVLFQRDISGYPFDPAADLYFVEEEKRIGDCPINSGWILDLYGPAAQLALENRTVLCSGTTFGRPWAVLAYLDAMVNEIDAVADRFRERFGYLGGIDQGIHNSLYYNDRLPDLNIRTAHNRDNLVYTIGHVAGDDPARQFLDARSRFINQQGSLCYCIHQFDRLAQGVRRAFSQASRYGI